VAADPTIEQLRERIAAVDRSIVAAVNERLRLVAELKRYKEKHGISFLDPQREQWLFAHHAEANEGPLSEDGLRAFYAELLALTKRELA
jgi:chorismate mutase / prephenate dehydratase